MVSPLVPTLCVGTHPVTLRVTILKADAERPGRHSRAERGNDQYRVSDFQKMGHLIIDLPKGSSRSLISIARTSTERPRCRQWISIRTWAKASAPGPSATASTAN
ncbi:hypothetical protein C1X89_17215 [Pseudomonas sp. GP01-A8]|nr:hypothetical protein C1X88_32625 [Pseudomonas sp. GP01-A13]PMU23366.1 hypothetical protein C1X90_16850 [Pseudomonas sp. GP01-A9]PMU37852.1 hypothetical protein C1X89_17215 [Pseudomonas sp. GP01-A8]PMU45523.1 hypothetical protein C1X87_29385 [Pseudomonas sp. GP01-A14]PMU50883.1 hypothetical protein C1X85_23050 [Pseudomonas sp. GP01-A6]PMU61543.1 hypothetical protein C1X86_17815 [Pseudomonas sp. GP01-A3]PMU67803.1 hypothetical protein C1X81_26700 [Pseudomonas sp. FW215-L2]PMU70877.1 hypothe